MFQEQIGAGFVSERNVTGNALDSLFPDVVN